MKIQVRNTHLYIRGPEVSECEAALNQIIKDHKDLIVTMSVESNIFGSIIGSKVSTIRRIQQEAGGDAAVKIDLDRTRGTVTIIGQTKEATVRGPCLCLCAVVAVI